LHTGTVLARGDRERNVLRRHDFSFWQLTWAPEKLVSQKTTVNRKKSVPPSN
jgi:hypothetical protein